MGIAFEYKIAAYENLIIYLKRNKQNKKLGLYPI